VRALRASGRAQTAVSFQVRSEDYGAMTFREIAAAVLDAASRIEAQTAMRIEAFNVGGGRSAREFDASAAAGDYRFLHDAVQTRLPHLRELLIEPGQELDFSLEAIVAPILESRNAGRIEIVIDAGRPDFPAIDKAPHRFFLLRDGRPTLLRPGSDRILGRTCLENDIVGTVSLPGEVRRGDAIVVADVGAYDSSMRYAFAAGRESGNTAF
jgi:diaminopimelate decarboxylase